MRICRIHTALSPKPKGFGIGLYELSLAQQKINNEIHIITGIRSSTKIFSRKYKNLIFNYIPYFPKFDVFNILVPFGFLSSFRLNQLIKNKMIDLIHTHDYDAFFAIKRNNKIPLVTTLHVDKRAQYQMIGREGVSYKASIIENFGHPLNQMIWRKSNAIICISRQTMKRLIHIYKIPKSKIYYIPNGVNVKKFNPKTNSSNLKSSLKIEQNYPIILLIGRIYVVKGIKEIISAISGIKKTYPKLLLLMIGGVKDKKYFAEVTALVKKHNLTENVRFIGSVPHSLMPKIYKTADIFILPSYAEGMPKVVLEAMASQLCVITTAVEGNIDLIENNVNGLLIKPKSVQEISKSLIKVIEDNKLREKFALNAWKTAQQHDWLKIAKNIQEVYKKVL